MEHHSLSVLIGAAEQVLGPLVGAPPAGDDLPPLPAPETAAAIRQNVAEQVAARQLREQRLPQLLEQHRQLLAQQRQQLEQLLEQLCEQWQQWQQ